ncbi:hypothetical protein [Mesorhizobium sp. M0959]|uniref:hypothetical protein n=1 Tax=unclassified Mesorhizobium TaxID=325217 RepID=UPI00333C2459
MDNVYIANDRHTRLILALAAIEPCPFTGKREPYQMVDALMAAEIWPASVQPGVKPQPDSESAIVEIADSPSATKETIN